MIIFKKISWKNFLSTGDAPTTIFFDRTPTTLIIGENGSGKSTILDALTFGLFGRAFRNINKPQLVNTVNERGLEVEIEFSIGKKKYLVRRGVKPNKFEIYFNDKLIDQLANNRDYQDYLEKVILKLNYKSFTQIVLLGNSSFEPFMQLKQSDRRTIVEDLLDIQIFSSMNGILKSKNSELKDDMGTLEIEKGLYKQKIEIQEDYIKRLRQDNESIIQLKEKDIQSFGNQKKENIESLNALHDEILELNEKMISENKIRVKNSEFNTLHNKIEVRLKQDEKELNFYEKNSTCSQCKQDIDDVFKKERIIDISKGIDEKKDGLDKIVSEIDTLEQQLEEFRAYSSQISEKNKNLAGIESLIQSFDSNIERTRKEIDELKDKKKSDNSVESELKVLKENLEEFLKDYSELCDRKTLHEYAHELLRDSGIKTK
ncbi:uncharacterized protein METZ01_LOCUS201012, partial [marine metagenome]